MFNSTREKEGERERRSEESRDEIVFNERQ